MQQSTEARPSENDEDEEDDEREGEISTHIALRTARVVGLEQRER